MIRVINKCTKESVSYLYTYFTSYSIVSLVDIEQVIVHWLNFVSF